MKMKYFNESNISLKDIFVFLFDYIFLEVTFHKITFIVFFFSDMQQSVDFRLR